MMMRCAAPMMEMESMSMKLCSPSYDVDESFMPQTKSLSMMKRSAPMKKKMRVMNNFDENEFINRQRGLNMKKEEFTEKEKTSEYMETHYKGETNVSSFGSLV
jgi:hypothetical protein